jgi:hypothetical protein
MHESAHESESYNRTASSKEVCRRRKTKTEHALFLVVFAIHPTHSTIAGIVATAPTPSTISLGVAGAASQPHVEAIPLGRVADVILQCLTS